MTAQEGNYYIRASEDAQGQPYLMVEPQAGEMPLLAGGFLSIELRPGTTLEEACHLAEQIRLLTTGVISFNPVPDR